MSQGSLNGLFPLPMICTVGAQFSLIGAIIAVYFFFPVTYVRLIAEDNWGEYTTFVAHMTSCCIFAYIFFNSKTRTRDLWLALLSIGTFLVAMEEISWGQRILDIPTPTIFKTVNFQREIGFHNIRAISPDDLTYLIVSLGFVAYGFILPLLASLISPVGKIVRKVNLPLPSLILSPLFLATAYFLKFSGLVKGEEIGELFMGISIFCLAVELFLERQHSGYEHKSPERKGYVITPLIIVMLFLGILLTSIWGSKGIFKSRLNNIGGVRLPAKGHFRQAEAILSYLERHPELAEEDMLINRGRLLNRMGRVEEGVKTFKQALDLEFERYRDNPKDPKNLDRIAQIYNEMGDEKSSRKFWFASLDAYDDKFNLEDAKGKKTGRRSRPAWTYYVWKEPPREKEKILNRLFFRAKTYKAMKLYDESIKEYLEASKFAYNAFWKNKIMWGIGNILSFCRPSDVSDKGFVLWKDVQSMARARKDDGEKWCSNGKEN